MLTRKPWRLGARARLLLRGLRYAQLWPFTSIDGWLTVDEAIELYELARRLPAGQPVVVEIGSWQGKSTVCLGKGLTGKQSPRLCCIDPFDASGDAESKDQYAASAAQLGGHLRPTFERNVRAAGLEHIVVVHQGLSHRLATAFRDPIDLLFIDGDHSPDGARRDFQDWAPKVKPGGFVALHDVVHPTHAGPRLVVDELLRHDPEWLPGHLVDSMYVAQKASRSDTMPT